MKRKIYKYIQCIVVLCLILVIICKVVDMHTDKIMLRDGTYYLYSTMAAGANGVVLDVEYGDEQVGANVHLWETNHKSSQQFNLKNVGDNKICIGFGQGDLCVGIAEDGLNLELQRYTGDESQKWDFQRIENSQYYMIQNCENGLFLEYERSEGELYYNVVVKSHIDNNDNYKFTLHK